MICLIAIGPQVTLVEPGGVVQEYILTWQAVIGPLLKQVVDWSTGGACDMGTFIGGYSLSCM